MQAMLSETARELLHAHRPFDALERQHLDRALELVDGAWPFESRHHFEPGHITASGFVLSPDRRDVLMIEHSRLGLWLQPGGHIEESDQSLEDAARREVFEETGLDHLEPDSPEPQLLDVDVHLIPASRGEPEHYHFDLRFLFIAPHRSVVAGQGVRTARFWPLAGIESRFDLPSLRRPLLKLRRIAAGLQARASTG